MRKQVQKERCTKIMLTKCKAVCCLYEKVQLAAAKCWMQNRQFFNLNVMFLSSAMIFLPTT